MAALVLSDRCLSHNATSTSGRCVNSQSSAPRRACMAAGSHQQLLPVNLCTAPAVGRANSAQLRRLPPAAATSIAAAYAKSMDDGFRYFDLELPPPVNSRVKKAEYLRSSVRTADCPKDKKHEFAVIGRSNVGKSSLINSLAESKGLARTSKSPGMTKLINHYLINDSWYLVDLPGYGYAKAGKGDKEEWLNFTKDFFLHRDQLVHVLLLIDASLPPQQIDVDCAFWLGECQVPFCIVFTKLDVVKKDMPTSAANMRNFKEQLSDEWDQLPWCFATSAKTGAGKNEVLGYMASLRVLANE